METLGGTTCRSSFILGTSDTGLEFCLTARPWWLADDSPAPPSLLTLLALEATGMVEPGEATPAIV